MIAFWYLLFFCWSVISLAKPLVAPRLSESTTLAGIGSSEFSSHSIPSLPSFLSPYLRPSPRAPTNVTIPLVPDVTMSSFAVFPLLAYSTVLAIFSFISVRIARWRRKRRPAALTLGDDDGVELLPTNTSTLSPRFKDLPVPPPLPSLVPLPASPAPSHPHSRSQSFSNLQLLQPHHHAVVVDLSDRPKSPLHFGLSSPGPGPRFNKSKRSHSVGSGSPLSPSKRRKDLSAVRRPFISDPESTEMDDFAAQRHITATVSTPNTPFPPQTQFGTLVDLSIPPVSVSTHPAFEGAGDIWSFAPSSTSNVEVNLIDLHAPEKENIHDMNVNLDTSEPELELEPVPVLISEFTGKDTNDLEDDELDVGYEPDIENDNENNERKEIDIGWEWGFESVSSLSMTSHPKAPAEEEEEEDLVDGNGSPGTTLGEKVPFHPIPVTASSSYSSYIHPIELQPKAEDFDADPGESIEPSDNGTLLSISRDDTSLDSDLIQRVYISDVDVERSELEPSEFGNGDVPDAQADSFFGDSANVVGAVEIATLDAGQIDSDDINDTNDTNDVYENNDYREGVEDEDADPDLEKGIDAGADADVDEEVQDEVQAQVAPTSLALISSPSSSEATTPTARTFAAVDVDLHSREVATATIPLTPPPSHERLVALAQDDDEPKLVEEEAAEEDRRGIVVPDEEGEFPDPDLLPLPGLESDTIASAAPASTIAESEPDSPKAALDLAFSHTIQNQIPTPPASPPHQRRALPRPLPAWSIRASDAPPLGLPSSTSSPILQRSKSFVDVPSGDIMVVEKELEIDEKDAKAEERPETPLPKTATLPGAFPVDSHPLADVMAALEKDAKKKTTKETGSPSSSGAQDITTGTSTALEVASATKATRRQPTRSPIDIALAMQLRPGLGLGADPAWMVRFLMAMFGWFVVLISGSAGDGYAKAPYVGIRRSASTSG